MRSDEDLLIEVENQFPDRSVVLIIEDHGKHLLRHTRYFYRKGMVRHIFQHLKYMFLKRKQGLPTLSLDDFIRNKDE